MIKYYGRSNKGFAKARQNRTNRAINRRIANGETQETSPALCDLMDRAYGQHTLDREGFETITRRELFGHKPKKSRK